MTKHDIPLESMQKKIMEKQYQVSKYPADNAGAHADQDGDPGYERVRPHSGTNYIDFGLWG